MNRTHISTGIMERMRVFESTDGSQQSIDRDREASGEDSDLSFGRTSKIMMMSSTPPLPGVQTDSEGLILPKKLKNPCMESVDRKQLHRELKFNTKIGKSVLNQKTELQRAYEKQRERQREHNDHSPTPMVSGGGGVGGGIGGAAGGLASELNRVIMERAQKLEHASAEPTEEADPDRKYVNPEYLNVRAKLRTGQRSELK